MKKTYLKLVFFYSSLLIFLSVIVYMIIISTGRNAITLNHNIPFKSKMNALAPQGWAFFTKDVRKDYFNIYKIETNKIYPATLKSSELTQYLGIRRDNRIINHKISSILKNIDTELWYNYKGNPSGIPKDSLPKISINVKEPMVYGIFLIEGGTPMPYDWYKSGLRIRRTMKYIQLEIKK